MGLVKPPHRSCEDISNDFSEGMPVSKAELIRLVRWERGHTQRAINQLNSIRDRLMTIVAEKIK
jgi:hypothetical protein